MVAGDSVHFRWIYRKHTDAPYVALLFSMLSMELEDDFMLVDHKDHALVFNDGFRVEFDELFNDGDDPVPPTPPDIPNNYTFKYDFTVKDVFP